MCDDGFFGNVTWSGDTPTGDCTNRTNSTAVAVPSLETSAAIFNVGSTAFYLLVILLSLLGCCLLLAIFFRMRGKKIQFVNNTDINLVIGVVDEATQDIEDRIFTIPAMAFKVKKFNDQFGSFFLVRAELSIIWNSLKIDLRHPCATTVAFDLEISGPRKKSIAYARTLPENAEYLEITPDAWSQFQVVCQDDPRKKFAKIVMITREKVAEVSTNGLNVLDQMDAFLVDPPVAEQWLCSDEEGLDLGRLALHRFSAINFDPPNSVRKLSSLNEDHISPEVLISNGRINVGRPISFETRKTAILPECFSILDDVAEMALLGNLSLNVVGHTNGGGDAHRLADYRLRLSVGRAKAVVAYLVRKAGCSFEKIDIRRAGRYPTGW